MGGTVENPAFKERFRVVQKKKPDLQGDYWPIDDIYNPTPKAPQTNEVPRLLLTLGEVYSESRGYDETSSDILNEPLGIFAL